MKNISTTNYLTIAQGMDFANLPDTLKESHAITLEASEDNWLAYNEVPEIKEMVDLYFEKLPAYLPEETKRLAVAKKEKQKAAVSPKKVVGSKKKNLVASNNKNDVATRSKAPEKKVKQPKYKAPVAYHDHFTEEETVIKSFINMNGQNKSLKQVKSLLDKVNKYIVERKIRKSSANAQGIMLVQRKLRTVLKTMADEQLRKIEIDLSNNTLALLHKFTKQSKVYTTVQLLKRFIGMLGTKPAKASAEKLMNDFTSGMKKGTIQPTDTYYGEAQEAVLYLNDYLKTGKAIPYNTSPALSGLGCPGMDDADCGCTKTTLAGVKKKDQPKARKESLKLPKALQDIFTPIDQPGVDTSKNTLRLSGDIGKFLGKIERNEFAIALRGDKGAGKTSLLYQLMDAFAEAGFDIGHFTLEINKDTDLVTRMKDKYIKPAHRSRVQHASVSPGGIDTIREAAKHFDVVAIDSWSKVVVKQDEFDKLRKDFPNTFFIVIFQSTTAGTARGGSMAEYDAGIVIHVAEGGIAVCEKNRYSDADEIGLQYLVFEQRLKNDN